MSRHICEYCEKQISTKQALQYHLNVCRARIVYDKFQSQFETKVQQELQNRERELQQQHQKELEEQQERIRYLEAQLSEFKTAIFGNIGNQNTSPLGGEVVNQIKSQTDAIQRLIDRNTLIERQILDGSKCHHGIQKRTCKDCFGADVCEHKKRKTTCKLCDPVGHLAHVCRSRIYSALKTYKPTQSKKSMEYLGCTFGELKTYLERKFQEGMSWENHGTDWHVDHIVPIRYESPQDIQVTIGRLHYTNLQPIWASENYSKGNRWVG